MIIRIIGEANELGLMIEEKMSRRNPSNQGKTIRGRGRSEIGR